jgi:hypothetical protein
MAKRWSGSAKEKPVISTDMSASQCRSVACPRNALIADVFSSVLTEWSATRRMVTVLLPSATIPVKSGSCHMDVPIERPTAPSIGFDAYVIVYCNPKPLLAAEVSLGRLNAHVAEKELNLLQFTACHVTQPCASASQIEQYHATKSSIANRYERFDSDDRRVFRTALLTKSRSGRRSTRFGVCFCFLQIMHTRSPGPLIRIDRSESFDVNTVSREVQPGRQGPTSVYRRLYAHMVSVCGVSWDESAQGEQNRPRNNNANRDG